MEAVKQKITSVKKGTVLDVTQLVQDSNLKHLAIIADGNRRWAREHNLLHEEGHHQGFAVGAPKIIEHLILRGIHTITIWCSSTWNTSKRSPYEVSKYSDAFALMAKNLVPIAKKHGSKIIHVGRKDRLQQNLAEALTYAEEQTATLGNHVINLDIDYSGRDEICRVIKKIIEQKTPADKVTEDMVGNLFDTAQQPYPNPDLLVRCAGEKRPADFMPWQTLYTEFDVLSAKFPESTTQDFDQAIINFSKLKRTFSK